MQLPSLVSEDSSIRDASFEAEHVHVVYDQIAKDFSRTRHTRWPFVADFMAQLAAGSVVLDAGCGNGKYLGCGSVLPCEQPAGRDGGAWPKAEGASAASVGSEKGKGKAVPFAPTGTSELDTATDQPKILPLGFDMSLGLLGIAAGKGNEAIRGDCFDMSCWRRGAFDHAISIATIHHFATAERRMESIKQIILAVLPPCPSTSESFASAPTARILIVVWAFEQDPTLAGEGSARKKGGGKKGAIPVSSLLDVDVDSQRPSGPQDDEQDVFVPWELQAPKAPKAPKISSLSKAERAARKTAEEAEAARPAPLAEPKPTFNRYYHLFRRYELSALVRWAARDLGAHFVCPSSYKLEDAAALEDVAEGMRRVDLGATEAGWELVVELVEERWERENWVGDIAVRWQKSFAE